MPLYEYHCNDCDRPFEKIVSFSEANRNPVCPNCQSQHTQKKISKIAALSSATGAALNSLSASTGSNCAPGSRFS